MDPTLDFNKRLNVQSLKKKLGKQFQKSMILKASKICCIPKSKLFVKNLREGKKQYSSKTKGLII